MLDLKKILCEEFKIDNWQVENTLQLKEEGATLPFIARYRKERTGNLDEIILRDLFCTLFTACQIFSHCFNPSQFFLGTHVVFNFPKINCRLEV